MLLTACDKVFLKVLLSRNHLLICHHGSHINTSSPGHDRFESGIYIPVTDNTIHATGVPFNIIHAKILTIDDNLLPEDT
jgi:hypothetical protein